MRSEFNFVTRSGDNSKEVFNQQLSVSLDYSLLLSVKVIEFLLKPVLCLYALNLVLESWVIGRFQTLEKRVPNITLLFRIPHCVVKSKIWSELSSVILEDTAHSLFVHC